jgi:hypothetical protein
MSNNVSVISGTDGLGETTAKSFLPWMMIAGVVGFIFWSTTYQIKGV